MGILDLFKKRGGDKPDLDLDAPPLPPSGSADLGFPSLDKDLGPAPIEVKDKEEVKAPTAPPAPVESKEDFSIPNVEPETPYLDEPIEKPMKSHRSRYTFVNANEFRTVLKDINMIKSTITGVHDYLSRLHDPEAKKEKWFRSLHSSVVDVQKKIIILDKTLFEKGDTYG